MTAETNELNMLHLACKAVDEKKAHDIKVIDIHEVSVIADYLSDRKRKQSESSSGYG